MKKWNTLLFLFITIIVNSLYAQSMTDWRDQLIAENTPNTGEIRMPGEFEPQDAVWLAWPAYDYEADLPMAHLTAEIIRELEPYVPVKLLVYDAEWQNIADSTLQALDVPTGHVAFIHVPYDEPWLRDMGPVFVIADEAAKQMVDFNFNAWGNYTTEHPYSRLEEAVDRLIAEWMGIPNNVTRLVGEGGNREFNGQGVMMSVAPTELQRNPNVSLEEIEEEFKQLFGVSKVIWLPHHLYDDSQATTVYPGPNDERAFGYGVGHVDELARFVGPNTILLAEVTEEEAQLDTFAWVNRQRLEENFAVLQQATNENGEPFEIIRIPAALTEYMQVTEEDYSHFISSDLTMEDETQGHEGPIWWVPAKSYCNFLITDGAVLAAQYWRPGRPMLEQEKDAEAVAVLESIFPNREIITFEPDLVLAVNAGGGGIHCITAQEPEIMVVNSVGTDALEQSRGLMQISPNPFRSSTTFQGELPEAGFVQLEIYDLNGQRVRTLASQQMPAGSFTIDWDGNSDAGNPVVPGLYLSKCALRTSSGETINLNTCRVIRIK